MIGILRKLVISVKVGRIFGIDVWVTPTILYAILIFAYMWSVFNASIGYYAFNVLRIISLYIVVLGHELGHAIMAKALKVEVRSLSLGFNGGIVDVGDIYRLIPMKRLLILKAGLSVNAVLAIFLGFIIEIFFGWHQVTFELYYSIGVFSFLLTLFSMNLLLLVYNSLPIMPLDGGKILEAMIHSLVGDKKAVIITANIGIATLIPVTLASMYFKNYFLLVLVLYLTIHIFLARKFRLGQIECQQSKNLELI
jgi:Zn-dependent protease